MTLEPLTGKPLVYLTGSADPQLDSRFQPHPEKTQAAQDRRLAIRQLRAVLPDRIADLAESICCLTTQLGLLHLQQGDLQESLYWFECAQSALAHSQLPSWSSLLSSLIGIAQTQALARAAEQRLAQAPLEIKAEIEALQAQAQEVAAQITRQIKKELVDDDDPHDGLTAASTGAESAEQAASIVVRAFGRFEVRWADGTPIGLCSNRKGQALFKHLATQPDLRQHKESLLDIFWPDEDPVIAGGKLHIASSRLRRALHQAGLGLDGLIFQDGCYCLNPALDVQCDVLRFDAHYRAGQQLDRLGETDLAGAEYQLALACYQGPYLAEAIGEEWPLAQRNRLEGQYLDVLSKLSNWHFEKQHLLQSAECCRRILEQDNLREDAYRLLMQCLTQTGQRNQALHLYLECARTLKAELDVAPMPETTQLYERIRRDQRSDRAADTAT
jgi:DNA-binding SARP family transcriptional activator